MDVKLCTTCKLEKSLDNFYVTKRGYYFRCKDCHKLHNKKRSKESRRKYSIKSLYGLTYEQFEEMLSHQNNSCYICNKELILKTGGYAIDHCHTTNNVRKNLCSNCNILLRHASDNIELLYKVIDYLKEHNQQAENEMD